MSDLISFLEKLAEAFFVRFADAVGSYPIPTAAVALIAYFLVWPEVRTYAQYQIVAALILFVCTVIAANVVGWIFNATLWVGQQVFGATEFSVSIFKDYPIEYVENLIAWGALLAVWCLYRARWRYKNISRVDICLCILPLIWISYVTTDIHVHIKGKTPEIPASSGTTKT